MNDKIRAIILKYLISICIGGAFVTLFLIGNGYSEMTDPVSKYRALTDAFSIPGVIFLMVGCLVFVSTDGFFDMLSYGLSKFARSLIPFSKKSEETFYEYKTRKSQNRFTGYSFLFFVGLLFLTVAIVFLILFFNVYS